MLSLVDALKYHTKLAELKIVIKGGHSNIYPLNPIVKNDHLQDLELQFCKESNTIFEFLHKENLQSLKLESCDLGLEDCIYLSNKLETFGKLVKLDVARNNIGPIGMICIYS